MEATRFLKDQHKQVKTLFKKVSKTEDAKRRRALLEEIGSALKMHTEIEEKIFYPAVRELDTKKANELIDEAFEEHHVVDLVLAELPRVNPEDDRFDAKMTVLEELVEHHVEEEEKEMFKLAKRLGKEELRALGQRMAAESNGGTSRARAAAR